MFSTIGIVIEGKNEYLWKEKIMKKILFLSVFLIFSLGFSDLKDIFRRQNSALNIEIQKDSVKKDATGGYIDGKWYAWYDNTFIGKEEVTNERFHKFKSLEIEVVGMKFDYRIDGNIQYMNNIYLKVSDFKLIDEYGNIYTPDNYPNELKKRFVPEIITNNENLERYFLMYANDKNLKFIGSEKKDKDSKWTILDTIPTKLFFQTSQDKTICSDQSGKMIYLDCDTNNK